MFCKYLMLSLENGAIPIIVDTGGITNLPFDSFIDWNQVAFRISSSIIKVGIEILVACMK